MGISCSKSKLLFHESSRVRAGPMCCINHSESLLSIGVAERLRKRVLFHSLTESGADSSFSGAGAAGEAVQLGPGEAGSLRGLFRAAAAAGVVAALTAAPRRGARGEGGRTEVAQLHTMIIERVLDIYVKNGIDNLSQYVRGLCHKF